MKYMGSLLLLFLCCVSAVAQALDCSRAQSDIDRVKASGLELTYDTSWNEVQELFGSPALSKDKSGRSVFSYAYSGCSVHFIIGPTGKVLYKTFRFTDQAPIAPKATDPAPASQPTDLQETVTRLQARIDQLERTVDELKSRFAGAAQGRSSPPTAGASPRPPLGETITPMFAPLPALLPVPTPPWPTVTTTVPSCTESGGCYGDISPVTGAPKTEYVNGYYRQNGKYVRPHYRSAPRR
jgi:hypothetical protein